MMNEIESVISENAHIAWKNLAGLSNGETRTLYLSRFGNVRRMRKYHGDRLMGAYTRESTLAEVVADAMVTWEEFEATPATRRGVAA